jgi:hypothetical protein
VIQLSAACGVSSAPSERGSHFCIPIKGSMSTGDMYHGQPKKRMSQAQLKVEAAEFMLRHLLRGGVGFLFSSKDYGRSPEIAMADNLAEVLFSK